jgi:hypothetical protein
MTTTNARPNQPAGAVILELLTGKWISQAITTAARLDLARHLSKGPASVAELAASSSANERALLGLLRALASVGIFSETEDGRFENTALSDALRADVPGSARALALFLGDAPTWNAWRELPYTIRTGKSAFKHANGSFPYEFFPKDPELAYFDEAFTNFSNQEMDAIHRAFDFSKIDTLVDVGGGQGAMLCSTLARNSRQTGILFDQPRVLEGASRVLATFGVGARCKLVGGDFFEGVPGGADGYMLKHVLFNWDDDRAVAILRSIRKAMASAGRLIIIDPVIQPGIGQTFAKFMDLEMMVLYEGGCQRTEAGFSKILGAAGFKVARVVSTDAPSSVLEALPA